LDRQLKLALFLFAIAGLAACSANQSGSAVPVDRNALDSQSASISASPTALTFVALGPSFAQTVVVQVGSGRQLPAVSSNAAVATVSPVSVNPVGDHGVKTASFTVTPVGAGAATVTIGDSGKGSGSVTIPVSVVIDVPLANGDSFTYAGTQTTQTIPAGGPASVPVISPVTQNETIFTGATFNGQSNLIRANTVTTITTGATVTTTTVDQFENVVAQSPGFQLVSLGLARTIQTNAPNRTVTTSTQNVEPAPLVLDKLPETAGDTWSVDFLGFVGTSDTLTVTPKLTTHEVLVQNSGVDGNVAAKFTFDYLPAAPPGAQLSETASFTRTTVQETATFSGLPPEVITVGAPVAGPLGGFVIPVSDIGTGSTLTGPALIPDWYPGGAQPPDSGMVHVDNGSVPIPASCGVDSSIATAGNQIHGVTTQLQTDGVLVTVVSDQYIKSGVGVVCTQMLQTTQIYNIDTGALVTTNTVQTSVGLKSVTLQSKTRRTASVSGSSIGVAGYGIEGLMMHPTRRVHSAGSKGT
jgi:hypothetical protein